MMSTEYRTAGGCIRNGLSAVAAAGGGLFFGGLALSRFGINHDVPLPDAIAAPRRRFDSPVAGDCNYYVDLPDDPANPIPLVLVHSINAAPSASEMQPLFDHYRGSRPVYALELPGFGFSERAPRRYSPDVFTGAIVDFLRDVVGQPADVVALSLASEFCARGALAQPNLFRSFVFISPPGLTDREITQGPPDWLHQVIAFPLWGRALFDLLTSRASINFFLGRQFVGLPAERFIEYAYATAHQAGAQHAPLYFLAAQLFTWTARETLYKPLTKPVLVLYDDDPNVSFERLPELMALNPHWQAQRIAPTRGLPHWEQPDATFAAIDAFWAQLT